MFTRWIWIGLGWSVAAILLTLLFLLGLPPLPIAAQTLPPPPANERTLTVTDSLTPTLPDLHYALAPAVTLSEAPGLNASSELTLSLPLTPSEKATLLELATLFFYDPATQRWRKLPTRRTVSGDQLYLTAPSQGPGRYAPALSTASDIGTYEQPWAPTLAAAQVDLFTGALSWSYPLDLPSGRSGQTPPLALTYHSGLLDALRGDFNPQASWVGLGWNLDVGYIARRIELDENFLPRYTQDFFLVLNGVSSKLVAIGPDQWRAEDERFWRVERQTTPDNRGGDFWLLTTPDGTQYRFGSQDEKAGDDSRYSAW